jgi:hypothetical protein
MSSLVDGLTRRLRNLRTERYPHGAPWPLPKMADAAFSALNFVERRFPARTPEELRRLISGRRVCVTGPSKGILRNPSGLVDSFDLVVRLNQVWPAATENRSAMGARCDILYHCCTGEFDLNAIVTAPEFASTRFVRFDANAVNAYTLVQFARDHEIPHVAFTHMREMPYLLEHGEHPTHPVNTGFFAICELLACPIEELFITGITFNCEDDIAGYAGAESAVRLREGAEHYHYADGAFEIFRRLLERDPRIRMDETLTEIVRLEESRRVERFEPGR